jgi:putative redox protein
MGKPPVEATLVWNSDLSFTATSAGTTVSIDGNSTAAPSPVQTLAISLAGCMAMDIVSILVKGRHPLRGLTATIVADRASEEPRRLIRAKLRYSVEGDIPHAAVERAIALSRDKYCSVWHSLRTDIELETGFEVRP